MTTTGYIIGIALLVICSFVMFVLGMRHGAKKMGEMLVEASKESMNDRHGTRDKYNYYPNRKKDKPKRLEEYIISDRDTAYGVLTTLTELGKKYGSVSVADYYDLISVPSNFTDNNRGWSRNKFTTARVVKALNGYVIKFPPLEVL